MFWLFHTKYEKDHKSILIAIKNCLNNLHKNSLTTRIFVHVTMCLNDNLSLPSTASVAISFFV